MFKKISLYFLSLVFVTTTIGSAFAVTLKASHQWPGTPRADGSFDVRHEMVQIIADEMKKANVGVDIRIYPAKSLYKPNSQSTELGLDWKGGFFCPCHGSKFDLSGRVHKAMPAPSNLEVPPYYFASETKIVIGQDGESV